MKKRFGSRPCVRARQIRVTSVSPRLALIAQGGIGEIAEVCEHKFFRFILILRAKWKRALHRARSNLDRDRSNRLFVKHLAGTINVSLEFLENDPEGNSMNAAPLPVDRVHRCAAGRAGALGELSFPDGRRDLFRNEL